MSKIVKTKMEPNDIIKRSKNDYNWRVVEELGAGGFGTVIKVVQVNSNGIQLTPKEYAMKTEMKAIKKQASRLKIERDVMSSFTKCDSQYRRHFPELVDIGQTVSCKWIVMTLVGPSLEKLKKKYPFTPSTSLQCALQTLKAIHDFHLIGYLHRDIKPANYCVGAGERADVVFMIDFGLARKYRTKNGGVRPPRPKTKMVGTPRYCPRASHNLKELGRKDDYESWFFMTLDLIDDEKGIPWKGKQRNVALEMKNRVFDEPKWISSISCVPPQFIIMGEYLNKLQYASQVEFGIFRETITDYARSIHLTLNERLDWIVSESEMKTSENNTSSMAQTTRTNSFTVDNKSIDSNSEDDASSTNKSGNSGSSLHKRPNTSRKPTKPQTSAIGRAN